MPDDDVTQRFDALLEAMLTKQPLESPHDEPDGQADLEDKGED